MISPILEYLNGLGLGEYDTIKFLARSTKPCPKCSKGKMTIARYKGNKAYFVCTGEHMNSLNVPVPDVGCGFVEYQIVSVIPQ